MKILDSVAAVFCNNNRIFAVRRQPHLKAFPGYDSFPGGKIDRDDPGSQHPAEFLSELDGRMMHALVREVKEELDYDLSAGINCGQVSSVKPLAVALAPATAPVRFRLHFFRIDLQTTPEFTPDPGEIETTSWVTPEELLASYHRGDALMVPPLRWVLEKLAREPQGYAFGDLSPQFDEEMIVPMVELLSGLRTLFVPANTLPPAKRTNAFLLGDDKALQILVDPSPESPEVLEKLLRTLEGFSIGAIFITHHHLDHHEHAPELAKRLNVPIWMSADTRARIIDKHGSNYFSENSLEIKQAGDSLTEWQGEKVCVYPVPGHDAGQLALAPESMRWFIVGDLIQNIGSVVIAPPEGDMTAYFQTLEKIIAIDPQVIIPSHGIPMRGTFQIQATLEHRRNRERSIYELRKAGKSVTEILASVYREIGPELKPFALMNIKSHLAKLEQEGKL